MAIWSLSFWYASKLVDDTTCTVPDVFRAITTVLFSALMAGVYLAMLPDAGPAQQGANNIYNLLNEAPTLKAITGTKTTPVQGTIEFKDVSFTYPSRQDTPVLTNLSFTVPAGATAAFVGSSGSGKSTIIALLERFYDVDSGDILIDGVSINDLDVDHYRHHVALVSQEPKLFNTTIKGNIIYGLDSEPGHVSFPIIACLQA